MKNISTSINDLIFSYSLKSEGEIKKFQKRKSELKEKEKERKLTKAEEIEKGIIEKSLDIMTENVKAANERISNADKLEQNIEPIVDYYCSEDTQQS
jgi:hypothetical protein